MTATCETCRHYCDELKVCDMIINDVSGASGVDMIVGLESYIVRQSSLDLRVGPDFGCIHHKLTKDVDALESVLSDLEPIEAKESGDGEN